MPRFVMMRISEVTFNIFSILLHELRINYHRRQNTETLKELFQIHKPFTKTCNRIGKVNKNITCKSVHLKACRLRVWNWTSMSDTMETRRKQEREIVHLWHVAGSTIPVNIMVEMLNLCHRVVTHKSCFIRHSKMSCLTKHPKVKGLFYWWIKKPTKCASFSQNSV